MQYEVARAIRDDDDEELTSSAAEAYALIREGLERFAAGDTEQARKFYRSRRGSSIGGRSRSIRGAGPRGST
jgi:hypothetical protein